MKIVLLTHQKEMNRLNNTGRWVKQVLGENALVIEWDRVAPNPELIELINSAKVGLLFPELDTSNEGVIAGRAEKAVGTLAGEVSEISVLPPSKTEPQSFAEFNALIIIDSTWQEARKIYNRSPYLKSLIKVSITSSVASIYQLRRNQLEGGLCTAECAAHILSQLGETQDSEKIMMLLKQQIETKTKQ